MKIRYVAGLCPAWWVVLSFGTAYAAVDADTVSMRHEPLRYQIVVSATKVAKDVAEVPNAATVIRGDDLRKRGTRTLAEALQDVVGLDTGEGSDNGAMLPNLGLWGLKEFDALLVTLDGVPVGGPFNPSLAQIPVEDIDRIEIVKGPQGTLYGVSAFAGMIGIYTREGTGERGRLTLGGGSFGVGQGSARVERDLGHETRLRLSGAVQRSDGWQDRTGSAIDRGTLGLATRVGTGHLDLDLSAVRHTQRWGTPLPYEAGALVPGFKLDSNQAAGGARIDHHVLAMNARYSVPLAPAHRIENTLGFTHDDSYFLRSFADAGTLAGDTVASAGVELRPLETTAFDDLRLVSRLHAFGEHELVTGAALTWGRTTADGRGFDFDQELGDPASVPSAAVIPVGDLRSFEDRRTFVGIYAHDEWTPHPAFTLSGGGRYDNASEKLHAQAQEQVPLAPLERADDSRTEADFSGDIAGLLRLVPRETPLLSTANLYANWKSAFKPAAPNLTEAEGARILDPEHAHSVEAGFKLRGLDRQAALDVSWFDMRFDNMVVAILDPLGSPALTNAGHERFRGVETDLTLSPKFAPGASLSLGYAHHDARFIQFTFVTPDGQLRDVSGKKLELVPRELMSARLEYAPGHGLGAFAAARYQGERPLNRRNTFFVDSYSEWDAGAWFEYRNARVSVIGRNLGDDRHLVTESEIGDSQFYPAAPRRVLVEASMGF